LTKARFRKINNSTGDWTDVHCQIDVFRQGKEKNNTTYTFSNVIMGDTPDKLWKIGVGLLANIADNDDNIDVYKPFVDWAKSINLDKA
jgi:hypothetical protein